MILVFGKTGQVASELGRAKDVHLLGRDAVDLRDPAACASAIKWHGPKAVVNAAAYTAVDLAEKEEALATTINGVAPEAMAQACARLDIPFVHISTDYVFDGSGRAPYGPGDPTAPLGAYGRSKLAGERAVMAQGGRMAVLRTSWVFSVHGGNFLKTMLRLADSRDKLAIVADQVGGPTPASAIAETCLHMTRHLAKGGGRPGLYHFAGAPDVSWAEFAREIFRVAGRAVEVVEIPTAEYPTLAPRPLNSRLDCSDLSAAFNIDRPDWQEAVHAIVTELEATA